MCMALQMHVYIHARATYSHVHTPQGHGHAAGWTRTSDKKDKDKDKAYAPTYAPHAAACGARRTSMGNEWMRAQSIQDRKYMWTCPRRKHIRRGALMTTNSFHSANEMQAATPTANRRVTPVGAACGSGEGARVKRTLCALGSIAGPSWWLGELGRSCPATVETRRH